MKNHFNNATCPQYTVRRRTGFTLVELLVAIAIIGILMSIAIPAIFSTISRAKTGAIRLEINALEQAMERYKDKQGDYPPDFSDWATVQRHYRKAFPRMGTNDATLLFNLLHSGTAFQAAQLDRAESLVWALGGYSDDIQRPFTGVGGPLVWTGTGANNYTDPAPGVVDTDRQTPTNFQINPDRVNSFFDFDTARLGYGQYDESAAVTGTNRRFSTDGDGDLFPTYAALAGGAPYVYFDSRSYSVYDATIGDFNGFASPAFGVVRAYFGDQSVANNTGVDYTSDAISLAGWQFVNSNKFQIVSAGLDNNFGAIASYNVDGDAALEAVFYQYPSGSAIAPRTDVSTPGALLIAGVSKYDETGIFGQLENFQLDNITNFSDAKIIDDVP